MSAAVLGDLHTPARQRGDTGKNRGGTGSLPAAHRRVSQAGVIMARAQCHNHCSFCFWFAAPHREAHFRPERTRSCGAALDQHDTVL
jgi:hypothetical protein